MGDSREEKVVLIEKILQKRPDSRRSARFKELLKNPQDLNLYLDMMDLKSSLSAIFKKSQLPDFKKEKNS